MENPEIGMKGELSNEKAFESGISGLVSGISGLSGRCAAPAAQFYMGILHRRGEYLLSHHFNTKNACGGLPAAGVLKLFSPKGYIRLVFRRKTISFTYHLSLTTFISQR
ncbi:hypothetical protein [uncultured Dialister sp.]|uniref:hypothetical protein n=1 Tax=uncultured Dialister sp. TaxID=278064 RepID=UPI0025D5A239|nr:hypothetical protein [uncultured Dialister sp.]